MTVGFSTAEAAHGERAEYWRAMVDRHFVALQVEPKDGADFAGAARLSSVDGVDVAHIWAKPMTVRRSQRHIEESPGGEYFVALHLRGVARAEQNGRRAVLGPGDFALLDSTRPYRIEFWDAGLFEHLVIRVPRIRLEASGADLARATARGVAAGGEHGRLVSSGLQTLASSPIAPELVDPVLEMLARALSARAGAPAVRNPHNQDTLRTLKRYALTHLTDAELSPSRAAREAWISVRQLHRLFAADGTTFTRFVRDARLQRCRGDLSDPAMSDRSIAEIAKRWGFPSPAHFTRAFAARYGTTPREMRRSCAPVAR